MISVFADSDLARNKELSGLSRLFYTDGNIEIIKCRFSNGSYNGLLSHPSVLTSTTILLLGVIYTKRTSPWSSVQLAKAPSLGSYTTFYLSWNDLMNICRRNLESFSASQEHVGPPTCYSIDMEFSTLNLERLIPRDVGPAFANVCKPIQATFATNVASNAAKMRTR